MLIGIISCENDLKQNINSSETQSQTTTPVENFNDNLNDSQQKKSNNNINPDLENNQTFSTGLLLGMSRMEEASMNVDEDPSNIVSKYKTVWIAPNGDHLKYILKENIIVAPGADGFYEYKNVASSKKKEYQETDDGSYPNYYHIEINKMVSNKTGNKYLMPDIDLTNNALVYYNETNNLLFVGNTYSVIYTSRIYTSGAGGYQYVPSINVYNHGNIPKSWMEKGYDEAKDSGIRLKDVFDESSKQIIERQISQYKKEFDKTVHVESDNDREYISDDNLSLERREGRWRLKAPIMFSNWKDSHNFIKDFKEIDYNLPKSIVSHDELCMEWNDIKKIEPDLVDAVTSPNRKLLLVQTSNALKVYKILENGISKSEIEIPISVHDKIIMNQWCTGNYVTKWDKELSYILK